jgi:hypothetical protein
MTDGKLTWEEARGFLEVGNRNSARSRCPHKKVGRIQYYDIADLVEYKARLDKRRARMSHSTGRDGMQALARTIIMFALVESEHPVVICGSCTADASVTAKKFLTEESWYTELLEDLAEWPDFFKACKSHFQKERF